MPDDTENRDKPSISATQTDNSALEPPQHPARHVHFGRSRDADLQRAGAGPEGRAGCCQRPPRHPAASRTSSSSGATISASPNQRLLRRPDGLRDAEHRPHRPRGHQVPALLWRAVLHRRPRGVPHRPARHPHRPDQGRLPGAPMGMSQLDPSVGGLLKNLGYATGQFGKNHVGDRNESLPTVNGFDEFFGNLYHLNAEEEPELPDYPKDPAYLRQVRPARRARVQGDRPRRSDGRSALRQDRQADHRGYRRADQEAHGDDRRRNLGRGHRLHEAAASRGQAVLRLVQLHAHASAHACPRRSSRPLHAWRQRIHRRHDGARRHRSARCSRRSTTWASRTTPSSSTPATTART